MKRLLLLAVALVAILPVYGQTNLTGQQKLEDFEYLYETIRDNYPGFEVLKRDRDNDWLARKEELKERFSQSEDDRSFLYALWLMVQDLGDPGATLFDPYFYREKTDWYRERALKDPAMQPWADAFTSAGPAYEEMIKSVFEGNPTSNERANYNPKYNIQTKIFGQGRFGILTFSSFAEPEKDEAYLLESLEALKECQHLMIDISKTRDGVREYWSEYLLPYLVQSPVTHTMYVAVPKTELAGRFYRKEKVDFSEVAGLPGLPPEITAEKFDIVKEIIRVEPKGDFGFKGDIYLRAGDLVCGTMEEMAQFVQATGIGKIGGIQTGGGAGFESVPVQLPHSKIILMCPMSYALNPDGSSNLENGTLPDIAWNVFSQHDDVRAWANKIEPGVAVPRSPGPYVTRVDQFKNGAQDVDPNLKEVTIRFNEKVWGLATNGEGYRKAKWPFRGYDQQTMDTDHRTLYVELQPDTEYLIRVISYLPGFGMSSHSEQILTPEYIVRFKTRSE